MSLRNVKGTRDLLPPETAIWQAVEDVVRRVFALYGYHEIRTPLLEDTELFVRGVGEGTDIVGKEMYTFEDRKGRSLTLRPENTAAVARAYLQHRLQDQPPPVKLFYVGPQFRYERPQRGRYRQFHQIGAELIGDEGPGSDAELLLMLVRFLRELEFESLTVRLNSVGDAASRSRFAAALREVLLPQRDALGEDSRRRLDSNPLRILDTKVAAERELLVGAPRLADFLGEDDRRHFSRLLELLDRWRVPYEVDDGLVRGLDYYPRTVFEIASQDLGAQDAILGGGRYDGLTRDLGGPEVPGIGFAIGQDRLVEVLPESFRQRCAGAPPVVVVPVGEHHQETCLALGERLRDAGVVALVELSGRSVKAALKAADRQQARFVVLLGDDEAAQSTVTVRDFARGEQAPVAQDRLAGWLRERLDRVEGDPSSTVAAGR